MSLQSQIVDSDSKPAATSKLSGHVYLVDDNEDIRRHLSAVLLRQGLSVSEFDSAERFLATATLHNPSVVLLDMSLPGANGVKTFESLRDAGWNMPVIFISGQSEPMEIIDAMKLGANDFLWKPFASSGLLDAVRKALASVRIQNEMATIENARINLWSAMTGREQEICKFILGGFGNTAIAERFNIQPDTANKHRIKVLAKIGVKERPELLDLLKDFELARS